MSLLLARRRRGGWRPTDLGSSLYAWFDASDISSLYQDTARTTAVSADNDPVGSWGDKSGNSRHLEQGTSGKRPLYRTTGTRLSFDGSDDTLSRAMTLGNFTLLFVAQVDSSGDVLVFDLDADGTHFAFSVKPQSHTIAIYRGGASSRAASNASSYSVGSKCCYAFRANGASPYFEMRRDGSQQVAITDDPGSDDIAGTLHLGSYHTGGYCTQGYFHELIVASAALSDTELGQAEAYLKAKWGTP